MWSRPSWRAVPLLACRVDQRLHGERLTEEIRSLVHTIADAIGILIGGDDVGGQEQEQLAPDVRSVGRTEQPADEREVPEQRHARACAVLLTIDEPAEHHGLPVAHEEVRRGLALADPRPPELHLRRRRAHLLGDLEAHIAIIVDSGRHGELRPYVAVLYYLITHRGVGWERPEHLDERPLGADEDAGLLIVLGEEHGPRHDAHVAGR